MIIKIKKYIIESGMSINKSDRYVIRNRLKEIDDMKSITRAEKTRLLEELTRIFNDLGFKKKYNNVAFDSSSYYGFKDLEYTFGDLDDYYIHILSKEGFDGNYQMYSCRGDKERNMSINMYLEKIKSFLVALIDKKKKRF